MSAKRYIKIGIVLVLLAALLAEPTLAARRGGRGGGGIRGGGPRSSSGFRISTGSRHSGFSFRYRQGSSRGRVGRHRSSPKHRSIIRPSPHRGFTRGNITTMYQTPRHGSKSARVRSRSGYRRRYGLSYRSRDHYSTSRRYYNRRPYRSNYRLNHPYRRYSYYRWPHRRYYYRNPYRRYYFYYGWPYVHYYYYYGYPATSYSYEYKSSDLDTPAKYDLAQTDVDRHLDKIADAFVDGNYSDAVIRARSAVSSEPESAALRFVYSQSLLAEGQYRKAASVLREALERTDPYLDGIFYNLGLYPDDNVLKQHISELRSAVKAQPIRDDLQLLLGYQMLSIGQYDQARTALEKTADDYSNKVAGEKLMVIMEKLTKTPKPENLEIPDKNDY